MNYLKGRPRIARSFLKLAVGALALLAVLACGGSAAEPTPSPTAPSGMFSTLPTTESPLVGDQSPTIELNTLEPTSTHLPTPAPDPTSTPIPAPTPDPTGTPIPTPTPNPTATPIPAPTPYPTATPQPTYTPYPTYTPIPAPNPTATPRPARAPQPTYTSKPVPTASVDLPGAPQSLSARADGETEIDLSWSRPSSDGGSRITGYRVEVSEDSSGWSVLEADTSRTRHTHRGLPSGSTRYYRVSAINSAGTGQPSNTANATTDSVNVPGAPQSLSARADGETEIDLSWSRPSSDGGSRITGYRIEVSEDGSGWSVLEADTIWTSYTHRGLTSGTTRYYRVSAINSAGTGPHSNTANATTDSVDLPGAPQSLSARADGETEINLSWSRPSNDGGSRVTGYRIEVSEDGSGGWSVLEADISRTSHTHRGLTSGSTRYYRVSATNSAGTGPHSNTAHATTDSVDLPGAPQSLSARADGETEIDLSWSRPSNDGGSRVTGYRIEVSEDGSGGWSVLEDDTSRTSHTHRGLTSGSTRHYRVSATNSAGTGPHSNTAHATTDSVDLPGAPQSLSARADGETEIELSWRSPSNDGGSRVTGYRIEVSEDGSGGWSVLEADISRTSHTHRGLTSGSTRHYRVSATNSAGTGPHSNTAHATTDSVDLPGAPQSLSARADGETEIELSWRSPSSDGGSRVTGYRIEVSEDGSGWSVLEADISRTSHTHRGLTSGSTRHYRVSAINSAGTGPPSNTAHATTDSVDLPGAPQSLSARADGETEIDLSWSRPSNDGGSRVTGYRIEVSEDGSGGWSVLEADISRTSHTHRGLTSGSTRYYRVSAINSAGTGPPSNTAHATTDSVDLPGAPQSLSARADGETEIELSWRSPSNDGGSRVTGYRIEVSEDGSGWSVLEADISRTSHTHRGLTSGSTRHYRVSAINSAGTGPPSNTAHATTDSVDLPGAPQSLSARADGETEIDLSWSRPSNDGGSRVTGYRIEVSEDGSGGWSVLEADISRTSHTHRGLTSGSTRYYRVSAINSAGTGPHSNTAHATTDSVDLPGAPQSLSARADGETEIELSWRSPSNDGGSRVTGYRIEVSEDGSGWSVLEDDTSRTSHTHRGLTSGSTRHYRVSATNSAGTGPHSNTAHATTATPAVCDGYKSDLLGAIQKGVPRIVQCVVDEGANVDAKDSNENPMLYWAITGGNPEIVRILVDAGANVDAKDSNENPMLYWAITGGNPEIVRILVDAGANVDAKDSNENPMLYWAITGGNPEIVRILVDAGANVDAKDSNENPMLYWAITGGNPEIVRILVDAGANVDAKDSGGDPMLYWAITGGNPELVRILVDANADVNARTADGTPLLTVAKNTGNQKIIEILKAAGATEE